MGLILLDWVLWMRRSLRDIALRVHVDVPQDLINHVAGGLVDVAIMYAPQHRPGLKIDLLMEEELVLVTTNPEAAPLEALLEDTDYVHVDWGPDFVLRHGMSFPEAIPSLFVNLGPLGLSYILSAGGSGYFRVRFGFRLRRLGPSLSCKSISLAEKSGPEFRILLMRIAKRPKRLCSSTTFGARSIDG
jgi:DNA-binding transcriptional LysR family regulator